MFPLLETADIPLKLQGSYNFRQASISLETACHKVYFIYAVLYVVLV